MKIYLLLLFLIFGSVRTQDDLLEQGSGYDEVIVPEENEEVPVEEVGGECTV